MCDDDDTRIDEDATIDDEDTTIDDEDTIDDDATIDGSHDAIAKFTRFEKVTSCYLILILHSRWHCMLLYFDLNY